MAETIGSACSTCITADNDNLQLSANCGERTGAIVRQRIGDGVQLVHGTLDAVEHVIERQSQV